MLSANALNKFGQTNSKLYSQFTLSLLLESMSLSGRNVLLSGLLYMEIVVNPASSCAAEGGICLSVLEFPATPSEICPVVAAVAPLSVPLSATATRQLPLSDHLGYGILVVLNLAILGRV